jgi:hypothetical protein
MSSQGPVELFERTYRGCFGVGFRVLLSHPGFDILLPVKHPLTAYPEVFGTLTYVPSITHGIGCDVAHLGQFFCRDER